MKKLFSYVIFFMFTLSFSSFSYADETVDEVDSVEETVESVEVDEADEDEDVEDVGRVTVTGSRIKTVDIEGATPITVITRADIDAAGYGTVYETVSNLTQAIGEVSGENFQAGFTPANQVVDLRDFGPGRTLVLVNGKRMADYPFPYNSNSASFNWASIPLAAVERIEILTAGASSIYGSDAVAGVINVVLVEGVEESTIRVVAGEYVESRDGFGQEYAVEFTTGGVMDRLTWTVAAEFRHLDPLTSQDRDEYDNYDDGKGNPEGVGVPWWAAFSYGSYYASDPRGYVRHGPSTIAGPDGNLMGWTCSTTTNVPGAVENNYQAYDPDATRVGNACLWPVQPPSTIFNERDNMSIFFSGAYTLSENSELYFKAMQFDTETTGQYFASFYYPAGGGVANSPGPWVVGYSNYGPQGLGVPNPVTGGTMWVADRLGYKMFAPPTWDNAYEETSTTIDVGIRRVLENGWEYDVSYTTNEYDSESTSRLWDDQKMNDLYFNIGGNDALGNPCVMDAQQLIDGGYWAGGFDPATDPYYAYIRAFLWGQPTCFNDEWFFSGADFDYENYRLDAGDSAESFSDFATASLVGEFGMLAGGPIGFALVAEYQDTGYDVFPSSNVVDGLVWGTGYVDSGGSRDRYAAGGELRLPLTSEFAVSISARKDKYDDRVVNVDRTTVGMNFEYRPNEDVLVRGGWSESFRAPDMQQAFIDETQGFASGIDYYQCWLVTGSVINCGAQGYDVINIEAYTRGNPNLKDESGYSSSLGVVWSPIERFSMTLDFYKVILQDIVSDRSTSAILLDEAYCYAQAAGSPIDNAPIYSGSYCQSIYDSIIRDGKPAGGLELTDPNAVPGIFAVYDQPLNIASQEYQGADWSMRYTLVTDTAGDFNFSLRGSNQLALKQAESQGESRFDYMNSAYVPRSRQVVTTSWNLRDWSASISISRIGHVNAVENTKLSPYMPVNAGVYYDITDDMYVGLTCSNCLDSLPDKDAAYGNSSYDFTAVNRNFYPILGPAVDVIFQMRF